MSLTCRPPAKVHSHMHARAWIWLVRWAGTVTLLFTYTCLRADMWVCEWTCGCCKTLIDLLVYLPLYTLQLLGPLLIVLIVFMQIYAYYICMLISHHCEALPTHTHYRWSRVCVCESMPLGIWSFQSTDGWKAGHIFAELLVDVGLCPVAAS